MTAATIAPGMTSRRRTPLGRKILNVTTNTAPLTRSAKAIAATGLQPPRSAPNVVPFDPAPDRIVVATTAMPTMAMRRRLRRRARMGFGRRLRGTDQVTFMVFWIAWATPRAPYNATRPPTMIAPMLP